MMNEILEKLGETLAGLNYVVFLWTNESPLDGPLDDCIKKAVHPDAVIQGTNEVTFDQMMEEVDQCIRWEGISGSHPFPVFQTDQFIKLYETVIFELNKMQHGAKIYSFFMGNEPFWPVQWGFSWEAVQIEELHDRNDQK